jgi:hypothetical protein
MKVKEIKLKIEKLRVIDFLIERVDVDNEQELTHEMLIKLKNEIEVLLLNDF